MLRYLNYNLPGVFGVLVIGLFPSFSMSASLSNESLVFSFNDDMEKSFLCIPPFSFESILLKYFIWYFDFEIQYLRNCLSDFGQFSSKSQKILFLFHIKEIKFKKFQNWKKKLEMLRVEPKTANLATLQNFMLLTSVISQSLMSQKNTKRG